MTKRLLPGEQIVIKYEYSIRNNLNEPILLFKLSLFDSETKEKFGDAMTGICTIQKESIPVKEPMRFSVTDEQFM